MNKYQYHLFVCTNQRPATDPRGCCAEKGSEVIRAALKEAIEKRGLKSKVRVNQAGCLDACAMGPSVVVYPQGIWYTVKSASDVEEIVERQCVKGNVVERLLMPTPWARGST
ncbi:MAG: (2Fe-2S) ferredoxin domain-containing protein [Nitrospirae bacterium]|nr:(2Fe-2S) ferredoxin domain-containing protein [Candidatus Troglogloeales bacterium]MBI3598766.1 (2Fe-2S) ferredoxin domain-containing protein [Candidatus Troglogloeales bacterium]